MVDKHVLRKVYLEKRLFLSEAEYETRNKLLIAHFENEISLEGINCIHLFLPIKGKKEVDTWALMDKVRKKRPATCFMTSKTLANGELSHYKIDHTTEYAFNKWGIPEPVNAAPASLNEIDMILIPLVTFDKAGHRIGYGKGYYDRFLVKVPNVKKVGLTLAPPLDNIHYMDTHDVQMDACVSPYQLYKF